MGGGLQVYWVILPDYPLMTFALGTWDLYVRFLVAALQGFDYRNC